MPFYFTVTVLLTHTPPGGVEEDLEITQHEFTAFHEAAIDEIAITLPGLLCQIVVSWLVIEYI